MLTFAVGIKKTSRDVFFPQALQKLQKKREFRKLPRLQRVWARKCC
jgi:hypothetical protein